MRDAITARAVLFDCDGVIADSEGIAARIMAEEISALGWPMTAGEAQRRFVGEAITAIADALGPRVGALPQGWYPRVHARIVAAMATQVAPVAGVVDVLRSLHRLGVPMAVASNSSRGELDAKIGRLDLGGFFAGRVFSYEDVGAPKPAPDLYLAAASACGVAPGSCVVVEDTPIGVAAARAAGCRVLGYAAGEASALAGVDIRRFRDMAELPGLLGLAAA